MSLKAKITAFIYYFPDFRWCAVIYAKSKDKREGFEAFLTFKSEILLSENFSWSIFTLFPLSTSEDEIQI